ncbi:MAG TPA: flagellar basal-body MS-ring/collar protein FliF [Deltaproteobacteria bacterium]|nr:flagellar basal-body MS-ring/collar protein FliF [Deltaproteobacteria bacterium]HOI08260.1 flagellar basal-body MS-ring/collar protein FliF [Deltaproteobacteria bacterium]
MSLQDSFNTLSAWFTKTSTVQKLVWLVASGMAVAVLIVSLMWAFEPKYQYLFTNLDEGDASLIVQSLKENRIPYKLTKGGTGIMVPEKNVYETRLSLASKGLPKGGSGEGFALFDQTGFSTSEFVQKINYQRALQNELANTIMSLEQVDYARVHIALPKESVFVEDEKPAKASIVIKPKAGQTIPAGQVQGIVYLVAKSVRGLDPEDISIVDVRGKVLYEGKKDSPAISLANNYLDVKRSMESALQSHAQDLLEKILGPGTSVVKVSADVDMDMVKNVEDNYDPEIHVVRSEELKNASMGGAGAAAGLAGTQSNLPTGRGGPNALPESGGNNQNTVVRNYEIGRNQVERVKSPGKVTRLTVSVVVDGTYKDDGKGGKAFVARSADELKRIEDAVKQSVGFSADREDQFSISCMPFAQESPEVMALAEKEKKMDLIYAFAKPVLFLISTLIILLFVVRPLMRWLVNSFKVVERASQRRQYVTSSESLPELGAEDLPQIEAMVKGDEAKSLVQGKRKAIEKGSKDDMNTATAVVKSWLQENV